MNRSVAIVALMLAAGAAGTALSGCTAPHPFIAEGNANLVEITYGGDIASTLPLARQHCARYERVPRLVDSSLNHAIFDCVRR